MCREDGGILDDLIVSRFEDRWGIVCNASNREKIAAWIGRHREGTDVQVRDETLSTAMVAIQGPRTMEQAAVIAPQQDLAGLKRYRLKVVDLMGLRLTVYRSGYTGEDGFEVVVPAGVARAMLSRLIGTKESPHPTIKMAGLGARDTLRIEAAMPLYGHELSEEVDSLTAGQAWCVDLNKEFIGAGAMRKLQARGLPRRLVGLELEGRRIARQHFRVASGGRPVGEVTSGTLSPTLGKSIAMALVSGEHCGEGTNLEVEIGGRPVAAKVVGLPFYKRSG
jgi:aminomethyltransferase